jgi:hypothetical protein
MKPFRVPSDQVSVCQSGGRQNAGNGYEDLEVISLIPTDRYYLNEKEKRHRPVLNGSSLAFGKLLADSDFDPLSLASEPGPLADVTDDYWDARFTARVVDHRHLANQFAASAVRLPERADRNGE